MIKPTSYYGVQVLVPMRIFDIQLIQKPKESVHYRKWYKLFRKFQKRRAWRNRFIVGSILFIAFILMIILGAFIGYWTQIPVLGIPIGLLAGLVELYLRLFLVDKFPTNS